MLKKTVLNLLSPFNESFASFDERSIFTLLEIDNLGLFDDIEELLSDQVSPVTDLIQKLFFTYNNIFELIDGKLVKLIIERDHEKLSKAITLLDYWISKTMEWTEEDPGLLEHESKLNLLIKFQSLFEFLKNNSSFLRKEEGCWF